MKNVLAVIHPPEFGGPHNQILQLNKPLKTLGWKTIAVLPEEGSSAAARLRSEGINVIQFPLHRLRAKLDPWIQYQYLKGFYPEITEFRRIIYNNQISLVQVCGLMNPHSAIAAKMEGVPVVWQLLGTTAPMALRIVLMPIVKLLADVIMATGKRVARMHPGARDFGNRLVIFFPPVNSQKFFPSVEDNINARNELGVPQNAFLFGTVGNFNKLKGHDILIESAHIVLSSFPKSYLRILGADTPTHKRYYERFVINKASQLGMVANGKVKFVNPEDRVNYFLNSFDIFVLTSRAEGIPTVVLEAMATGIPVVSNDVGSVREIIDESRTGLIVDHLNPQEIALAIIKLIDDINLRIKLGNNSRKRVLEEFDVDVCAETHAGAYKLAINNQ